MLTLVSKVRMLFCLDVRLPDHFPHYGEMEIQIHYGEMEIQIRLSSLERNNEQSDLDIY